MNLNPMSTGFERRMLKFTRITTKSSGWREIRQSDVIAVDLLLLRMTM